MGCLASTGANFGGKSFESRSHKNAKHAGLVHNLRMNFAGAQAGVVRFALPYPFLSDIFSRIHIRSAQSLLAITNRWFSPGRPPFRLTFCALPDTLDA
jgi:hypothetical protein